MYSSNDMEMIVLDTCRLVQDNIITTVKDVENDRGMIQAQTSKTEVSTTTIAMNALGHIFIALLVFYIVFKSFEVVTLFSWHPAFMAIGFLALMSEAILALSDVNVTRIIAYRNLVFIHWVLQLLATVCIAVGFATIYLNKNIKDKPHFHSNHAIFGLVTTILVAITSIGGVFTKYGYQLRDYVRPVYSKIGHAVLGSATFLLSAVTIVLGFYTHWYRRNTSPTIQFGSSAIVIIMTLYILYKPIKKIYSRVDNVMRSNL